MIHDLRLILVVHLFETKKQLVSMCFCWNATQTPIIMVEWKRGNPEDDCFRNKAEQRIAESKSTTGQRSNIGTTQNYHLFANLVTSQILYFHYPLATSLHRHTSFSSLFFLSLSKLSEFWLVNDGTSIMPSRAILQR